LFLNVGSAQYLEKRQKKQKVVNNENSPTCLLIAKVVKNLGSTKKFSEILNALDKKCQKEDLITRIRTSIETLRKNQTASKSIMAQAFFKNLFTSLLEYKTVKSSIAGKKIENASKNLGAPNKLFHPNRTIKSLGHIVEAGKNKKSRFDALNRFYRRFGRRKTKKAKKSGKKTKKAAKNVKKAVRKTKKLAKKAKKAAKDAKKAVSKGPTKKAIRKGKKSVKKAKKAAKKGKIAAKKAAKNVKKVVRKGKKSAKKVLKRERNQLKKQRKLQRKL